MIVRWRRWGVVHRSSMCQRELMCQSSSGLTSPFLWRLHFLAEPRDDCRRWCKKDRTHVGVRRPAVIATYNKYIGGVDMCDIMISYHKIETRTRRWNFRVIAHFIDLALSITSRIEDVAVRLPSGCWVGLDQLRVDGQFIGRRP